MSETSTVVGPLLKALNEIPGLMAFRMHSGSISIQGRHMRLNAAGTPDLLVLLEDCKPVFVECKLPKESLSADQVKFLGKAKRIGVEVLVVFSVREGIDLVTKRLRGEPRALFGEEK